MCNKAEEMKMESEKSKGHNEQPNDSYNEWADMEQGRDDVENLTEGEREEETDEELVEGKRENGGVEDLADARREEYKQVAQGAEYWHGTGRYQYDKDGGVVDVLRGIIENRGLRPQDPDNYNAEKRGQLSTSLGKSRETSLKYADIHNEDPTGVGRNESMEEWIEGKLQGTIDVMNYNMAMKAVREGRLGSEALQEQMENVTKQRPWASHFRRNAGTEKVAETFRQGSDIPGDYPILLGIGEVPGAEPLAAMPWHEARVEGGVGLEDITHLEVPSERIGETREVLAELGVDLPVVAIETGEEVWGENPEEMSDEERMAIERAREWKEEQEEAARLGEQEREREAKIQAEVRKVKERLVEEVMEYYTEELGESELPGLVGEYLGDERELVTRVRGEAKEMGLGARDFVEELMGKLGEEKLAEITGRIYEQVENANRII